MLKRWIKNPHVYIGCFRPLYARSDDHLIIKQVVYHAMVAFYVIEQNTTDV